MQEEIPRLLFNTGKEDKDAIREVLKAGLKCRFIGPLGEEETPQIIYDSVRFYGLEGVKDFIKRWKTTNGKTLIPRKTC